MAAGGAAQIIHYPATVIVGPTTTTTPGSDRSYGGTLVGKVKEVGFQSIAEEPFAIWTECYGEHTDELEKGKMFQLGLLLRGWDDDAVQQFQPGGYAAGAISGHAKFTEPGTRTPGQSVLEASNARDKVLLILPEDTIHVPALIVYRAVANWTPAATIAMERKSELGIPLTFDCMRNSSGNIYQWSMLADLDLT